MVKNTILLLVLLLTSLTASSRVVGYSYLTDTTTTDFDFSKYTHVIGAFVFSDKDGNLGFSDWNSAESIVTILKKAESQGAIPMIALGTTSGGWAMTKNDTARANFIQNLLEWCEFHGVKGIDLDLEGNAAEYNWGNPATFFPEPYEALAVELRAAMPDSMLLTSAVGSHSRNGAQWTDTFLAQLDWINVMVYDRYLSWESSPVQNHSGYEGHLSAADYWHSSRGLAKESIVLGVPFYARGWDRENNRVYRENPGWDVTTWDYRDFVLRYSPDFDQDTVDFPAEDSIRYERADGVTGQGTLFFNSPEMIKRKTVWTVENEYSGIMIWPLNGDVASTHERSLLKVIDTVITQSKSTPIVIHNNSPKERVRCNMSKGSLQLSGLRVDEHNSVKLYTPTGRLLFRKDFIAKNSTIQLKVSEVKANGTVIALVNNQRGILYLPH